MSASMDINTQYVLNFSEIDHTLHCCFSGKLDGSVCTEIEHVLDRRITEFRKNRAEVRLVFDLAEVTFISAAFLRVCLMHCKVLGKNSFSVMNVSEEIYKVFHISSLVELMNIANADTIPAVA